MASPIVQKDINAKTFDVICAGEALWRLVEDRSSAKSHEAALKPAGGAVEVAISLAKKGLRVGLATVLADDALGRSAIDKISATGVDVGGVRLTKPNAGIVVVDARRSAIPMASDEAPFFEIPVRWSSQILLLSGLSPSVSHAAALCKAARKARRAGTLVLVDFRASLRAWKGRDSRTILMILREVDAAWCSLADLAVLGMDAHAARAALREGAVFVASDETGKTVATGPFGEVTFVPPSAAPMLAHGVNDTFTTAICAELSGRGDPGEASAARWDRALRRGYAAATQTHFADRPSREWLTSV